MNAENAVQLFILVWTFTAVCQADDDVCSVSCDDVTGTVGKKVTLICNVSGKCSECCIKMYKFQYPEKYKDSIICRQDFPQDSCEQRNSFTCKYTYDTTVPGQFRFLAQTKCGPIKTEFSVNKKDGCSVSFDDVTGTVGKEVTLTCSIPQNFSECCIKMYKFYYTEIYEYAEICRQDLPQDSCEQRNSFTCNYTSNTTVLEKFRFFENTRCRPIKTEFTVYITEPSTRKTDTTDPGYGSMFTGAVVGCFIIIIIIGIFVIFFVKRFKRSDPSGLRMQYERSVSEEPTMMTVNDHNETK